MSWLRAQLGMQHLDRGELADQRVLGAVDRAHAADAQLADDAVAADDRPRSSPRSSRPRNGGVKAYRQNAASNAATSFCVMRPGQSCVAAGSRLIIGDSLHATVLFEVQTLAQPHMQSSGSAVAVRPSPNPIAPTAKFTTRCVGADVVGDPRDVALGGVAAVELVDRAAVVRADLARQRRRTRSSRTVRSPDACVTTVTGKLESCARTPFDDRPGSLIAVGRGRLCSDGAVPCAMFIQLARFCVASLGVPWVSVTPSKLR